MAIVDLFNSGPNGLGLSVLVGASLLVLFWRVFARRLDPREPPPLAPGIPLIGHVIGMLQYSHGFYPRLYKQKPMPASTLPMLNGKMYFITSPDLISEVLMARTLSFDPFVEKFITKLSPVSKPASKIYKQPEFEHQWGKLAYGEMTGSDLAQLNRAVLTNIFRQLNNLPQNFEVENTFKWVRNIVTISTVNAILGPRSSWTQSLVEDYWTFDENSHHFVSMPIPQLTAPAAYKARARVHEALKEYYDKKGHEDENASNLVKGTNALQQEYNWSNRDRGALMLNLLHGALTNSVPIAYWSFTHIFSKPDLVTRLRDEVGKVVSEGPSSPNRKREMVLDVAHLEERVPLLAAALRETQRLSQIGTINRWVIADTVISDGKHSYLLKKDNPLQISVGIGHVDAEHWGPNAADFDPARFMKTENPSAKEWNCDAPVKKGVFIPFGGGKHLCPGRNFASVEIWGTLIVMLLGFRVSDPEGYALSLPERAMPMLTAGIGKPVEESDLRACVRRRKGWENVVWKVVASRHSNQ